MYTVVLDENNIEDYQDYLEEDAAENLERSVFRGLVLLEEGSPAPRGWMIWEIPECRRKRHYSWLRRIPTCTSG